MLIKIPLKFSRQLLTYQRNNAIVWRTYQSLFSKEFDISQFCTILVKCPYNINIKPIDVFQSQEKTYINVNTYNNSAVPKAMFEKQDNTILVDVDGSANYEDCTLNIDAPIKASININGNNGKIDIGSFYGQFITAHSENGDINLSKCQCEKIHLITNNGNIVCKDVTQAADITLQSKGSGKISTDRLQGLKLKVLTSTGPIEIGSSYCDTSTFESNIGKLNLNNVHKNVTVNIKQEGLLNIVGMDGNLFVHMKKGLADIHLARIINDANIFLEDESSLILRLSDECQKNSLIEILTKTLILSDDLKMNCERSNESCKLLPKSKNVDNLSNLKISCEKSDILVNAASWSELLHASFKNRR